MTELSKVYGGALFDLSAEENISEEILSQFKVLNECFAQNPDFAKILDAPNIKKEEKLKMLDECFADKINERLLSFIKILCEKGIAGYFADAYKEFCRRYNTANNIMDITAVSAAALNEKQMQSLMDKLNSMYSGKTINLSVKVEPQLIGGMRLELEGKQLDGSVKANLAGIKSKITATM